MATLSPDQSQFDAESFFSRAAERLSTEPAWADDRLGDHHLNPDLSMEGITFRDAAVLIPVIARDQASILLTLRTAHLPTHAGQIAFPGGKVEPSDPSPLAAALREAEEEVGLDRSLVSPIGYLDPYLTRTGYRILPILGRVEPSLHLTINPQEVVETFEVPLSFLMTPENHRQGTRLVTGVPRYFYEMPFGDRYIWGITAGIIRQLYQRVYG